MKFSKPLIPLIMENKIHSTMEVLQITEEELIVIIIVYDTIELKNLILSYGSNVEVIEPNSLRHNIKEELIKACQNYG